MAATYKRTKVASALTMDDVGRALNLLDQHVADAVAQINNGMATTAGLGVAVPIGVPVPWFKHLLPANYVLPSNWVPCDGRTIKDPASPMNGVTIPNINGLGYFIRGSATAGTVQAADTLETNHTHGVGTYAVGSHTHLGNALAAHQHEISTSATTGGTFSAVAANNRIDDGLGGFTKAVSAGTPSVQNTQPTFTGASAAGGAAGAETRPVNISAFFIVRIK